MLRISSSTHLYRTPPTLVSFGLGVSKLHGAIAHALEQQFPDSVETEPETLAHHFTEAGLTDRAIEYWRRAGERSFGRPAYVEAIKQLTKGLELTRSLPPSSARDRRELGLLIILSQAVSNSK